MTFDDDKESHKDVKIQNITKDGKDERAHSTYGEIVHPNMMSEHSESISGLSVPA